MRRPSLVVTLASALAGLLVLVLPATPTTFAWYTDSAAMDSGTFTAATVPPSTMSCGALGALSVTFSWTAVPGATDYTLHYGSGGANTVAVSGTTYTVVTAIASGTAWVVANRAFAQTTWSSVASNSVSYTVAAVSLCS